MKAHRKINGRMAPKRRMDFRRPCWNTFYWLGVEANNLLEPVHSYVEIGRAFGVTKQNAFTECMVALGKVVFALRSIRRLDEI
jgi:hypothetical protein